MALPSNYKQLAASSVLSGSPGNRKFLWITCIFLLQCFPNHIYTDVWYTSSKFINICFHSYRYWCSKHQSLLKMFLLMFFFYFFSKFYFWCLVFLIFFSIHIGNYKICVLPTKIVRNFYWTKKTGHKIRKCTYTYFIHIQCLVHSKT